MKTSNGRITLQSRNETSLRPFVVTKSVHPPLFIRSKRSLSLRELNRLLSIEHGAPQFIFSMNEASKNAESENSRIRENRVSSCAASWNETRPGSAPRCSSNPGKVFRGGLLSLGGKRIETRTPSRPLCSSGCLLSLLGSLQPRRGPNEEIHFRYDVTKGPGTHIASATSAASQAHSSNENSHPPWCVCPRTRVETSCTSTHTRERELEPIPAIREFVSPLPLENNLDV